MRAVWIVDYDMSTDQAYKRPGCDDCDAPVSRMLDGRYHCICCGKEAEIDGDMIKYFEERSGEKILKQNCPACGKDQALEVHQIRNCVTLKWQTAHGECSNCGMHFTV